MPGVAGQPAALAESARRSGGPHERLGGTAAGPLQSKGPE